jgi:KTSC domain
MCQMPSTVIRRFHYVPDARELIVELVTGRRYLYSDVPQSEVDGLRSAFAKGVYFNRRIRSRYAYRELSAVAEDE